MKKVFTLIVAVSMVSLIACGPSAEEKAAQEKAKQDSIAMADSIRMAEEAAIAAEQAKQDSIANAQKIADSIAAAEATKKGGKKK